MSKIMKHHYVLAVPDAEATNNFFINTLKFNSTPVDDDGWRFVSKDDFMIMLGSCPESIPPSKLGDHSYFAYFVVEDIDTYYQEILSTGYPVNQEPKDKPWNMREVCITTPDGHRIMLGQTIVT